MFEGTPVGDAWRVFPATYAMGYLRISGGVPSDTQIFTINGRIYELDTNGSAATGGQVLVSITGVSTADQFCTAIAAGINGDSSRSVNAVADLTNDIIWLYALNPGSAGNAITLTEGLSNTTPSGSTLSGGNDQKTEERHIYRYTVGSDAATGGRLRIKTDLSYILSVDVRQEDAALVDDSLDVTVTISGGYVTLGEGSAPAWADGDVLIVTIVGGR